MIQLNTREEKINFLKQAAAGKVMLVPNKLNGVKVLSGLFGLYTYCMSTDYDEKENVNVILSKNDEEDVIRLEQRLNQGYSSDGVEDVSK